MSLLDRFMYLTVSVMKAGIVLASSHPCTHGIQGSAWLKAGFQEKCTLSEFVPKKGWVRGHILKSVAGGELPAKGGGERLLTVPQMVPEDYRMMSPHQSAGP